MASLPSLSRTFLFWKRAAWIVCFPHVSVTLLLCLCLVCFSAEPAFVFHAAAAMQMCPAVGPKRQYKPTGLTDPRVLSQAATQFQAGDFVWQGGLGNGLCRKEWRLWCLGSWVVEFWQATEVDPTSRTRTVWDSCWRIVLIRTSHVPPCWQSTVKAYPKSI